MTDHTARLQRLDQARHEPVPAWRWHAVVDALPTLRGGPCTVAVTMGAAMEDRTRLDSPRTLMQCRGWIPSDPSSGEPWQQGARTKAGNTPARRVLGEGAWASRSPAQVRRHVLLRLAKQSTVIQASSWQAHVRLGNRSQGLGARGTHAHVGSRAMARELTGWLWAMAKEVPSGASDEVGSG
jgi:transposase